MLYKVTEDSVGSNWQYEIDDNFITWEYEAKNQVKLITGQGSGKTAEIVVYRRGSMGTTESANYNTNENGSYDYLIFNNKRKYVKLSGYAFEDKMDGRKVI